MTWMEVVKGYKITRFERGWWLIEIFGGERFMYWIEYKLFICLDSYSRFYFIGIKID